jgi:hypothetical protein
LNYHLAETCHKDQQEDKDEYVQQRSVEIEHVCLDYIRTECLDVAKRWRHTAHHPERDLIMVRRQSVRPIAPAHWDAFESFILYRSIKPRFSNHAGLVERAADEQDVFRHAGEPVFGMRTRIILTRHG